MCLCAFLFRSMISKVNLDGAYFPSCLCLDKYQHNLWYRLGQNNITSLHIHEGSSCVRHKCMIPSALKDHGPLLASTGLWLAWVQMPTWYFIEWLSNLVRIFVGNLLEGQFDLEFPQSSSLRELKINYNAITSISAIVFERVVNLEKLRMAGNDLRIFPDVASGVAVTPPSLIDISSNDEITWLHAPAFRLLHGTTIKARDMRGLPCNGHLCWYIMYEWSFTIDGEVSCEGNMVNFQYLNDTYLRCAGQLETS